MPATFQLRVNGKWVDLASAVIDPGDPGDPGTPTFQNVFLGHNSDPSVSTITPAKLTARFGVPMQAARVLYNQTWSGLDLKKYLPGGATPVVGSKKLLTICTPSSWTPDGIIAGTYDSVFTAVMNSADPTGLTYWSVSFEVNSGADANGNGGKQGYTSGSFSNGVYTPGSWAKAMKHLNDIVVKAGKNHYFRGTTAYFIAPQNGPARLNNAWNDAWLPPFSYWNDPFFSAGFDNYTNPGGEDSTVANKPAGYYAGLGGQYPDPRDVVDRWYALCVARGYTFEQGHIIIGEWSTPQRTWDTDGSGQAACLKAYVDHLNSLPCPPFIANVWENVAHYDQNWSAKAIATMSPYYAANSSLVQKP